MWQDWFNIGKDILALLLTGLVIKITDDYIDQDEDRMSNSRSLWLDKLDKGVLPYTIIIFSIALFLNFQLCLGLFLGAFIVGMFKDPEAVSPLGLKGYQEAGVFFIFSVALIGLITTLEMVALMLLIQFVDDSLDYAKDYKNYLNNFFIAFGPVEATIILAVLTLINAAIQPVTSIAALSGMILINRISAIKW